MLWKRLRPVAVPTVLVSGSMIYFAFNQDKLEDLRVAVEATGRGLRTAWCAGRIAFHYYNPLNPASRKEDLQAKHEWGARKLVDMLARQRGVYVKLGQYIGSMDWGGVIPMEYCRAAGVFYAMAPASSPQDVRRVVEGEMRHGKGIQKFRLEDVFEEIQWPPIGVASLAQVHLARLKGKWPLKSNDSPTMYPLMKVSEDDTSFTAHDGWVALKVQHGNVRRHASADILTVKTVIKVLTWLFPAQCTPWAWVADEMARSLPQELDFRLEARNAGEMSRLVNADPELRGKVRVPGVWWPGTTQRILTMELIGAPPKSLLQEKAPSGPSWLRGFLPEPFSRWFHPRQSIFTQTLIREANPVCAQITDTAFLDKNGIDRMAAVGLVSRLWSRMLFRWGLVHCDPHPGNLLILLTHAKTGSKFNSNWQLVLLDHGIYRRLSPAFKAAYARLWVSLVWEDGWAVRDAAVALGAPPETYPLFSAILTHRPYHQTRRIINRNSAEPPSILTSSAELTAAIESEQEANGTDRNSFWMEPSREEVVRMRERAALFIKPLGEVLSKVPRELPLLLKVNDLLASLERKCLYNTDQSSNPSGSVLVFPGRVGRRVLLAMVREALIHDHYNHGLGIKQRTYFTIAYWWRRCQVAFLWYLWLWREASTK